MRDAERSFLALVAIGVFRVDGGGAIWKHRRLIAGSRTGSPPYWRDVAPPQRAETSESDGYPTVLFSDGETRKKVFAHRIVWMVANQADIPEPLEVNHKDGVRTNAHPLNLELMTPSGNVLHGIHVLGRKPTSQRGERHAHARLTAAQVAEIRRLCETKAMAQTKVGEMFGVSQRTVSEIYLRKTWREVP
jgi:hypothetical protein